MIRMRLPIAVCVGALALSAWTFDGTEAQGSDPTTWPLVQSQHLQYIGAFRLPANAINGDDFSFSGGTIAFNSANNSLYVSSRTKRVAEVNIPTPVINSNITALPFAAYIQGFADPTEEHWDDIGDEVSFGGLLKHGNKLIGTGYIYYDASNSQRVSHFSRSVTLSTPSFTGFSSVWDPVKTGFVSGYMSPLPSAWQSLLGGPALTGNCCIPIVSRTSYGPAAFAFDPDSIATGNLITAQPLLYYTGEHQTLGPWSGSAANSTYGSTTSIAGLAVVDGTRTALYFGVNGSGEQCYGNGTSNQGLHGTTGPDGEMWCYDPAVSDKGPHAYPYNFQLWAYDLNDFAAVKAGTKYPWDVVPYGVWPITLPFNTPNFFPQPGGAAYDPATRRLFVVQRKIDEDGYASRPLVYVFQINTVVPANPVTSVAITSNLAAPQPPNTAITFTATPTGGNAPVQYKWFTYDGCSWTFGNWTTSNQFVWTPATHNANVRVGVWAKSATNADDVAEANASVSFPIAGGSGAVASVSLASDGSSPQPAGSTVVWTATATGGSGSLLHKWLIYDGNHWVPVSSWSTSNTYTWRPSAANGGYRVAVWVKQSTNGADVAEASASQSFIISGS